MNIAVPTLSNLGWVKSLDTKVDALMTDLLVSNYSQSFLYYGNVKSLQKVLSTYDQINMNLESDIKSLFEKYLSPYFPEGVEIDIRLEEPDNKVDNRLNIKAMVNVIQDGKSFNIGYLLEYENSVFRSFSRYNDTGVF